MRKGNISLSLSERKTIAEVVSMHILFDIFTMEELMSIIDVTAKASERYSEMSPLEFARKLNNIEKEAERENI